MKSLKEQADPNCEVCKGTGQDTRTTGFTCVCDCVKEDNQDDLWDEVAAYMYIQGFGSFPLCYFAAHELKSKYNLTRKQ